MRNLTDEVCVAMACSALFLLFAAGPGSWAENNALASRQVAAMQDAVPPADRADRAAEPRNKDGPIQNLSSDNADKEILPAIPLGPSIGAAGFQQFAVLEPVSPQMTELLKQQGTKGKRLQIGFHRPLDEPIVVNQLSAPPRQWTTMPNRWRVWSVAVSSPGAQGLRIHLNISRLPPEARIVVYDPANPMPDEHPITVQALGSDGEAWTRTVFSDLAVVECQLPDGLRQPSVEYKVLGVSHIYQLPVAGKLLKEGTCHNDVSCYSEWAQEATSVASMAFVDQGNVYVCTGCLLEGSSTDLFLTANHCIPRQSVASTIELFWFYQTSSCNGTPPALASVPTTSGGAQLLATSTVNDFTFLRLHESPPAGTFHVPWTVQPPGSGETLTCIHHPGGAFKRISFGKLVGSDPDFWGVQWFSGVTEDGSSGSPLFNSQHQVIGQLNGGFNGPGSSCLNPTAPDQYGRFDGTYDSIKQWLGDSGGTSTTNLFLGVTGTYYGLFQDPSGVSPATSGYFTLTVTSKGKFTGALQLGHTRYAISGQVDSTGAAQATTGKRTGLLAVQLQLDLTGGTGTVTGTVGDGAGTWTANLTGNQAVFNGKSTLSPQAGRYTVAIAASGDPTVAPRGTSYATAIVDKAGRIRLAGMLADGTSISQSTVISREGSWPLYVPLYNGQGSLFSWVSFADNPNDDLSGNVTWIKPAIARARYYPSGFAINTTLSGSAFSPASTGNSMLNLSGGQLTLTGGNLDHDIVNQIILGPNNHLTNPSGNKLSMSFSNGTGLFTGRVIDPVTSKSISFKGVVLQKSNSGSGFFLGSNQSGLVSISP